MKTSKKQISLFTAEELTLSQEAFLVSPTQQQESDLERKMSATCGRKCLEQYEKCNRGGLWARTFPGLLIGRGGWFSTRCRLNWKLKGTKSGRLYFQLQVSTLRTDATGSGLLLTPTILPTPRANQVNGCNLNSESLARRKKGNLEEVVAGWVTGLLPTPQAIDGNGNGRELRLKKDCNRNPNQPGSWRGDLKDFAAIGLLPTPISSPSMDQTVEGTRKLLASRDRKQGNLIESIVMMLPTPATRDYKGARSKEALEASGRNHTNSLPDAFAQTGISSQLNPQFVAEMMGFPTDWTELPFQNGEPKV